MPNTLHERSSVLPVTAPFALDHSLSFLCSFPPTAGEQALAPRAMTKALSVGGHAVLARVEEHDGALACTTWSEGPQPDETHAACAARLRFQLSLDDDLTLFTERAHADPAFAPVARRFHGHHHVKFPSPFEIAVWAVLAQRNMRLGKPMKDALVRALGPTLTHEGVTHRAFPEPEALTDAAAVRALVPTHADAIVAIARAFSDAALVPALLAAPLDEADAMLRALPRIGPWSAAFILFRGLGRMERLAERSDPILRAARRVYGARSEPELRALAASYGPFCGYWALYLRRATGT